MEQLCSLLILKFKWHRAVFDSRHDESRLKSEFPPTPSELGAFGPKTHDRRLAPTIAVGSGEVLLQKLTNCRKKCY